MASSVEPVTVAPWDAHNQALVANVHPADCIEFTRVLDNGNGSADSFQVFLQGAGECLVDNVEVFAQGGPNLVVNPTFESSFSGWYPQGTHDYSFWQNSGGYGGGKCLHIVATGRG